MDKTPSFPPEDGSAENSYIEYIESLQNDAVTAALEAELSLQRHLIEVLQDLRGDDKTIDRLFVPNTHAASFAETSKYWNEERSSEVPGNPTLEFLNAAFDNGRQPVFSTISLCIESTNPTVFLPVPYAIVTAGETGRSHDPLAECLGVNADGFHGDVDQFLRRISQALVNISYSVRLNDRPLHGWLAAAHTLRTPIYIPNVRDLPTGLITLPENKRVISVSTREEYSLGMASVLYLPVFCSTASPAPIVLMFWSPIPRRWDQCLGRCVSLDASRPVEQSAVLKPLSFEGDAIRDTLWRRVRFLQDVTEKDRSDIRRAELELLTLFALFERWVSSMVAMTASQFGDHFNDVGDLIGYLVRVTPERDWVDVRRWVDNIVRNPDGFVKRLQSKESGFAGACSLPARKLYCTVLRGCSDTEWSFNLAQRDQDERCPLKDMPIDVYIHTNERMGVRIAAEPAANIAEHASDIEKIDVSLTERFVTVRYYEKPTKASRNWLFDEPDAFRRYYAARRGLVTPRPRALEEYGRGLGLWIYHLFEARAAMFRKLYVSPDGKEWYTEITLPVSSHN